MNNLDINEQKNIEEIMLKNSFALKILETELDILLEGYAHQNGYNPVEHRKSRLKTLDSAFKKLEKKGYEINSRNLLKHIHDMIGIRIVCSFLSDVYTIVELIKNSKQFAIVEEKDYIKNPKETGYISYHIIIVVPIYLNDKIEYVDAEIQIRTLAMDFWASLDHKLRYKVSENVSTEMNAEIYKFSNEIKKLDKKMNELNQKVNNYRSSDKN